MCKISTRVYGSTLMVLDPLPLPATHRVPGDVRDSTSLSLKPKRTSSEYGRILNGSFDEEFLERVRAYANRTLQEGVTQVQGMGGAHVREAKEWHGMRRFRLRTLRRVNIEVPMFAAGQT